MIYSKLKPGVWVKYEDGSESGLVLFKRRMLERKAELRARLAELPKYPGDAELLEWAKQNYKAVDTSREKALIEANLAMIDEDLAQMVND